MKCPLCGEEMTQDNTEFLVGFAAHDPEKVDLVLIHNTKVDEEDCGGSLNWFPEITDATGYNSKGELIP